LYEQDGVLYSYYTFGGRIYQYVYEKTENKYVYRQVPNVELQTITIKDWRTMLYFEGVLAEQLGL